MRGISTVMGLVVLLAAAIPGQDIKPVSPRLDASFSGLPVYFIENRGVYPEEVRYYVQGADRTLLFTKKGITFRLKGDGRSWVVKLEFAGANPDVQPRGEDRQEALFSYFRGPEKEWKTGLETYSRIVYEDLWPGIDLVYMGTINRLKYEFIVKPGADPGMIRLRYRGATEVTLAASGGMRVETPAGCFEDEAPAAYQRIGGKRVHVDMTFAENDMDKRGDSFGFLVGEFDRTRPLILDPAVLVYCGYIGGSGEDYGSSIALDAAGNVYVTGLTRSDARTFPVKVGPDLSFNGGPPEDPSDVFVAKVNKQGTGLVYCGYIGGAGREFGTGIAVDAAGNAYVTGHAGSDEKTFPVKVGPDLTHNGNSDAFVAKINAQGTALVYCGFIGGNDSDLPLGIAVDAAGNAYVTGETASDEKTFPVKVGPDLTYNGATWLLVGDAFVAKVNAQGTALVYCGYIGGNASDFGNGIAVDAAGNAYVVGCVTSTEQTFPVKVGPDLTFNGGFTDAFVAKVNAQGTALDYCGYIGGSADDTWKGVPMGIAVDAGGNAYVTGDTKSNENTFPVTVGPDLTHNGGTMDTFVAKVNASGTALVYCGYIGGAGNDRGLGITVDAADNAYVTGYAESAEKTFPVKAGPDLTYNGGPGDAFVARVNAQGTALDYCGFIGGSGIDYGYGIVGDAVGNVYVAGVTASDERTFPVTAGPDLTYNGGKYYGDAFVAKITQTVLGGSGATRPGGRVDFSLVATGDSGLQYQVGSSLGTGPINIGKRKLDLSPDNLLAVSASNSWPWIFSRYRGVVDTIGKASAAINIPNLPALVGLRIHTAFGTMDPTAPSGIRSISNTFSFTITK